MDFDGFLGEKLRRFVPFRGFVADGVEWLRNVSCCIIGN